MKQQLLSITAMAMALSATHAMAEDIKVGHLTYHTGEYGAGLVLSLMRSLISRSTSSIRIRRLVGSLFQSIRTSERSVRRGPHASWWTARTSTFS